MNFYDEMKKNVTIRTENGALGYETSGKKLLDLNFAVGSLRGASEQTILDYFRAAWNENPTLALRWLFFARDIKGGLGERNLFRVILKNIVINYISGNYTMLFNLIEKYGRYDDFVNLIGEDGVNDEALVEVLANRLGIDLLHSKLGKPYSLLAKWMPSINTSSNSTKARARKIAKILGISHAEYRVMLSTLRKGLDIVESKISRNDWEGVNYNAVPSYANLKYSNAFLRHDEERRRKYLSDLSSGKEGVKINANTLYTYDIVHKYRDGWSWSGSIKKDIDETLENLWKNLPSREISNTLVVSDGSGSMAVEVGNSRVTALDVAESLAIYFSEHNKGEFKNKYITFSEHPRFVEFNENDSLRDKLIKARKHDEVANTNICAVFNLILKTAKRNNISQEEMPNRILIISDMEFDCGATFNKTLFEEISDKYEACGYKLPRLIFWNTNSRTNTIPVQENENGVALVSGFSTTITDMIMSDETDPYKILTNKLEEYREVDSLIS